MYEIKNIILFSIPFIIVARVTFDIYKVLKKLTKPKSFFEKTWTVILAFIILSCLCGFSMMVIPELFPTEDEVFATLIMMFLIELFIQLPTYMKFIKTNKKK